MGTAMTGNDSRELSVMGRVFRPDRLLSALTAGGINAFVIISIQISLAAMLFSGELVPFMSRGLGFFLIGTFIVGLVTASISSYPNSVALVHGAPVAILILPLAGIAAAMKSGSASQTSLFYTLVCTMGVSTLTVGLLMVVMARFRLGILVRFVPYPVIGGFMAGTGWLLVKGGIGVMAQVPMDLTSLSGLFTQAALAKWVPGLAFALILFWVLKTYSHFLVLPGMILGGIALFFLTLKVTGTSFSQAEALGWFLGSFPEGTLWSPIPLSALAQVRWDLIMGQALTMVSVFVITTIALLLTATSLELASKCDIDLNREMKVTGLANILAAFTGSPPGSVGLASSTLNHKLSPGTRLPGITYAILVGIALIFGSSLVSILPRPMAGAILVFLGLGFLWEWVYASWGRLPKTDYFLILVILAVVAAFGFLQGVGAGIVIAVILFVVNYSRISIVRSCVSGRYFQSNVERAAPQRFILNRNGEQVLILQLQGFVFFGTANQLRSRIRDEVRTRLDTDVRYIILDFARVNGCDSSAMNSFERICQFSESLDITLVFVNVRPLLEAQFETAGVTRNRIRVLSDLDHGMEWCEEQILAIHDHDSSEEADQLFESTFDDMWEALGQMEAFETLLADMAPYLIRARIEAGEFLFRKGVTVEGIFLVESGQISILLEQEDKAPIRLRTAGEGSVVGGWGERNLNREDISVKGVIAGNLSYLSEEMRKSMEQEAPDLAFRFYKHVAQVLSERLGRGSTMIRDLI